MKRTTTRTAFRRAGRRVERAVARGSVAEQGRALRVYGAALKNLVAACDGLLGVFGSTRWEQVEPKYRELRSALAVARRAR